MYASANVSACKMPRRAALAYVASSYSCSYVASAFILTLDKIHKKGTIYFLIYPHTNMERLRSN